MLAKRQVFGVVDIDGLQGPSEVMIVADSFCNPENIAHEILAQAEHDALAQSILLTDSKQLAVTVSRMVESEMESLNRAEIANTSIETNGLIVVVGNLGLAVELVNSYAPEHLVVDVNDGSLDISRFTNAGCVFTGKHPTVVMGDYIAGPSHALPTGGTARFSSPLNVSDFIRYFNVVNTDDIDLRQYGPVAVALARAEGLTAHARALEYRLGAKD
jgi:histidinol dehydrogenase